MNAIRAQKVVQFIDTHIFFWKRIIRLLCIYNITITILNEDPICVPVVVIGENIPRFSQNSILRLNWIQANSINITISHYFRLKRNNASTQYLYLDIR